MGFNLKKLASIATAIPTGGLSLLASSGSGIGGLLNDVTGVSDSTSKNFSNSLAMLDKEYQNNVALWNMENEYNTPAAQMARMKQAGIDINPMTYAVGNGNMSTTAGHISAPSQGAGSGSSAGNPISMLMSVLSGMKQLESMDKDIKLKEEAIKNYPNEHQSEALQIANFLGALMTGRTYDTVQDVGMALHEILNPSSKPSSSKAPQPAFFKFQKNAREWWNRIGKHSTKYGDGTWKEHLLD